MNARGATVKTQVIQNEPEPKEAPPPVVDGDQDAGENQVAGAAPAPDTDSNGATS
jgi:hypothetical protein